VAQLAHKAGVNVITVCNGRWNETLTEPDSGSGCRSMEGDGAEKYRPHRRRHPISRRDRIVAPSIHHHQRAKVHSWQRSSCPCLWSECVCECVCVNMYSVAQSIRHTRHNGKTSQSVHCVHMAGCLVCGGTGTASLNLTSQHCVCVAGRCPGCCCGDSVIFNTLSS